ncbi:MAG: glutamate--cysteine ligase [Alphaproteobacteria bacterium]|jgi:glutamate--cysteine ligase|nr:glutamate--cysteine ligase [Alphaproteobacteria bacterium]MDP6517024.1 glutamate--cysteine ligase [Alphaproteobacteria bacterium]
MTGATETAAPITDRRALIEYLEQGCKPRARWRIGTEHEKIGYRLEDLGPLPYAGPRGIRALLEGLQRFGWTPIMEGENVIALTLDGQSVTLEPGGQLELSGGPLETVHQTCREVDTHLDQVREVAEELGIGFFGGGMQPKWRREQIPVMPKGRYKIMRAYMPGKGDLGLDMMMRTCTVQVNLDFESEACMSRMFRVGLALQPVATALFANSPFLDGKPNGYLSYRSHVWTDTDPDRCGFPRFVFEDGMGFERYADYVLDVPMYFVHRGDRYIDASGQSFRDFLDGRLAALPGERPTLDDWVDHLTTVFTEVRLKQYLEMRGADGGPGRRLCALPALWVGLLYEKAALDAAWSLVKDWTHEEVLELRAGAARQGLKAPFRTMTLRDVALEVLEVAKDGLKRRARLDSGGQDEVGFLTPLDGIAQSGLTPAEELLEAYEGRWRGSVDPLFTEHAY